MYSKTTDELAHEIKIATNAEDFLNDNKTQILRQSLSEYLYMLLEEKRVRRADVVRNSMLDRAYVYQIFSGEKTPSRDKLIAIAFGLKLTLDEAQKMLKISGNRELYPRDQRDALIMFTLNRQESISKADDLLHDHQLDTLLNID